LPPPVGTLPPLGEPDGDRRRPRGALDGPRYALYDAGHLPIFGPPVPWPGALSMPVIVDGATVGTLYARPLPAPENRWDQDFARAQTLKGLGIAIIAIALSILGASLFADRLARPLRALRAQAAAIAAGKYEERADATGPRELRELAADFNAMASALQRSQQSRRRWTAEMSHELRTPVSVIQAEIDALRDGIRTWNAAAAESLSVEVTRLSALIDDLYQLSLADAGALDYRFEPVDLAQLVDERVATFALRFDAAGLTLQRETAAPRAIVQGDRRRLTQLIDNLLTNSLRYTDRGGAVRIALCGSPTVLRVEDSAPGVPAADLERIFEPLARAEASRNRDLGGAGLGLAIARRIAEAHGATLRASASALGGLAVELAWPA
jgi:two-component system sensor histidine kinase BaeS